jgi:tetratricopeptide (TPR) repeat protein
LVTLAIVGGGGILLVGWVFTFGLVAGQEFSPELFERRTFFYHQIPILGIQVRPVVRDRSRTILEQFLVKQKYVPVTAKVEQARWDLVFDNYHADGSSECDASILCEYLDTYTADGDFLWEKWSRDHTEQAKLLWPAVAELAQAELYVVIPEVFEVVDRTNKTAEFKTLLKSTVADGYCRFAQVELQRGEYKRAMELFNKALNHQPQSAAAFRGRADVYRALGENEKAAAESAEADKFEKQQDPA